MQKKVISGKLKVRSYRKKDADDRAKTVEPVIKAMRDSGNTWDQIAKHMNKLSIPTARGGKWHGKTVLNAHQRLS
jgi:hypothetical protein